MYKNNYHHCIIQLVHTLAHHFDGTSPDYLSNLLPHLEPYKKIILALIDGLGLQNLKDLSQQAGFLYTHLFDTIDTVYPPTTVAATTSLVTGKEPVTTGWLGWYQYFQEYQDHYVMFLNQSYYNYKPSVKPIRELVPYHYFWENLPIQAYTYAPFPCYDNKEGYENLEGMIKALQMNLKKDEKQYHYFYYDKLDELMHKNGTQHEVVQKEFNDIQNQLETLASSLDQDTQMIVIADHGHIDVEGIYLGDYPDLLECLEYPPSLEGRTMAFKVKDKEKFVTLFHHYFDPDFTLYSYEEILQQQLFGIGEVHPYFKDFIGDFIAVGITNKMFYTKKPNTMKGNHAGMTKTEIQIPLIVIK